MELNVIVYAAILFTSGEKDGSTFVISEPEGLNRRVIYVEGSCKAYDRLLVADLRTQHLVLVLLF
jgi:hypothetical protein